MKNSRKNRLLCVAALSFYLIGTLFLTVWLLVRYVENESPMQQSQIESEELSASAAQNNSEERSTPAVQNGFGELSASVAQNGSGTLSRENTFASIRVCLKSDHYEKELHEHLTITSDAPWTLFEEDTDSFSFSRPENRKEIQKFEKQELFSVSAKDFSSGTHLIAVPSDGEALCLPELKRDIPQPQYSGKLHLYVEEKGLRVVNEVALETYLESVVASEMPSFYPLGALKAQAVCARTYAVRAMESQKNRNSFSDLDDSVAFQVYNNQIVSDASARAVNETDGEILPLSEALYYSTAYVPGSKFAKADLSDNDAFAASLEALPKEDAEYGSPWVRWHTTLHYSAVLTQLKQNFGQQLNAVSRIEICGRSPSGQASRLLICGDGKELCIEGEYDIRMVLAPKSAPVCLKSGQEITGLTLLPSAWLSVEYYNPKSGTLSLSGGGYGHGIGMSQCGAAAMAEDGADYHQILDYYYGESELEHVKNL